MTPRRGPHRVAVLGAGPAGLSAAHALLTRDPNVIVDVFESASGPGGCLTSVREQGFLFELGPNSMNAKHSPVHRLIHHMLGLTDRVVVRCLRAKNFYIVNNSVLEPFPSSLPSLFRSKLLSLPAKFRIFAEPFIPRLQNLDAANNESIAAFFTRRFGCEIADVIVDAGVAGIYSGDTARLSMKHTFARFWNLERQTGSVVGGMLRGAGKANHDPRFPAVKGKELRTSFSFDEGLQVLGTTLGDYVDSHQRGCIRTNAKVRSLRHVVKSGRWFVNSRRTPYDAVISTIPAHSVQRIRCNESAVSTAFAEIGNLIQYAPISVVVLGYNKTDIGHKLDGFGALVPSKQPRNGLLGITFSTSNYPERSPSPDKLYVTAYVGGQRAPDIALLPARKLVEIALREVQVLLRATSGKPIFSRVKTWAQGIPQYTVGDYDRARTAMREVETKAHGFVLAGNYRDGVGLPDSLLSGMNAADRALATIAR